MGLILYDVGPDSKLTAGTCKPEGEGRENDSPNTGNICKNYSRCFGTRIHPKLGQEFCKQWTFHQAAILDSLTLLDGE